MIIIESTILKTFQQEALLFCTLWADCFFCFCFVLFFCFFIAFQNHHLPFGSILARSPYGFVQGQTRADCFLSLFSKITIIPFIKCQVSECKCKRWHNMLCFLRISEKINQRSERYAKFSKNTQVFSPSHFFPLQSKLC